MWRTVLITVVCVTVEAVLGFALAMLLVKNFRGRGLVTVFFLLPMMVVPAVSGFIFVPHSEPEYNQAVAFLDELIDIVKEDENHPLASLMELVGTLIEKYENEHVPELA